MTQQTEDTRSRAALGFRPAPPVKPNKGGRPRKAGIDREPNGQASRRLVIDLRPTPEQIARGAGDGLGPIDDPVSILRRLGKINDLELRIANGVEALYRDACIAMGCPKISGSALDQRITSGGGDDAAGWHSVAVKRWARLREFVIRFNGPRSYAMLIMACCDKSGLPRTELDESFFRIALDTARDCVVLS